VQLAYSPVPNVHFTATTTLSSQVGVSVPIRESSAAEGTLIEFEGVRAAIEAPNGERWTSPWQRLDIPKQLPGQNEQSLALFTMPRAVYNRMREMPLKIHLDFAVSLARVSRVTEVRLPLEDFAVPGFGVCAADTGWLGGPDQITGISCRSALRQPSLTYIHVVWSDLSCRTSGQPGADDAGVQGAGWAGSLDRTPANFGVVSVWATNFALSNGSKDLREINTRFLCLGSPLTFTQYELVRRAQAALDIQDFHLPDPPPILPR
jgi:hypothetical protein